MKNGENVLGCFIGMYSPSLVEIIGYSGFDFVIIDDEHGAFSHSEMENMIRTAQSVDLVPIVRVSYDCSSIQKALDRGALGIQVPMVNSRLDVEKVLSRAKFPPVGKRGAAFSHRAARYNKDGGRSFLDESNEETLVIVHIETLTAAENFEEIVSVPGVDLAFIGSTDLAVSMGFDSPNVNDVQEVIDSIYQKAKQLEKPIGIVANDAKSSAEGFSKGASYIAVTGTSVITSGFTALVNDTKKLSITG